MREVWTWTDSQTWRMPTARLVKDDDAARRAIRAHLDKTPGGAWAYDLDSVPVAASFFEGGEEWLNLKN